MAETNVFSRIEARLGITALELTDDQLTVAIDIGAELYGRDAPITTGTPASLVSA